MSLSFRRKLFVVFVFLFVVTGIGIVYYSKGYRFDFSTFKIKKTGAVYVETFPKNVQIFLGNHQYKDKSGILQRGTLISNVIPKRYRLTIKKESYFDYQKNIEVFPSEVVSLINVRLIPQKIEPTITINNFKGNIIVDTLENKKIITLDLKNNSYYLWDIKQPQLEPVNLLSKIESITKQKISQILFYPQTNNSFIVSTNKGIYRIDLESKSSTVIKKESPNFIKLKKNNLYILSPTEFLSKTTSTSTNSTSTKLSIFDLILNSQISEIQIPFNWSTIKDFEITSDYIAILLKDGALWLCDRAGNPLNQIAHWAKQFKFSDDGTKLIYQDNDGKTFVYLTKDELIALNSKKGQVIRLGLIDSQKIKNIWYLPDSFHLILNYPDKISIAEITNFEPNNQFKIISQDNQDSADVFYDNDLKYLYILSQGTLYVYDIKEL